MTDRALNQSIDDRLPERQRQALREVGQTEITRPVTLLLAGLFAASLLVVPLLRPFAGAPAGRWAAFRALGEVGLSTDGSPTPGLLAANRRLIAGLRAFEDRLEEDSWPRRRLLPPLQGFLTARLGLGNEQAYPGRDGWLYYRPDVDHLTGPGFLEPAQLLRRRRGGAAWEEPPQPDPVLALTRFARQLEEHGARLVVLPIPVKPAIEPQPLAAGEPAEPPLRNPSWGTFVRRLKAAEILVVDPAPALAWFEGERYLRTDTHWRPAAMELVASHLARAIGPLLGPPAADTSPRRRPVIVENAGDIATMLRLPVGQTLFPAERVTTQMVVHIRGRPWRPDPVAEVLLLGDSFTNVYSDPALGWGRSAGLAEQLAYSLARPVDKLALNAGGAYATRAALARALASGRTQLAGKRVIVYQFAARELSSGDWRPVTLPNP